MSTRIGVISEGAIDHVLLNALLPRIAEERVGFTWPVAAEDVADLFPLRKRGHGGVLDTVRRLVTTLDTGVSDYSCYVILLDRKTLQVQTKLHSLVSGKDRFILAVAIEEIEAWWLGDRTNTLAWSALTGNLPGQCRYAREGYQAERDTSPKRTLDELTRLSNRFDRTYGEGNLELAEEFAREYWRKHAKLDEIAAQCPTGYQPFEREMTNAFHRARSAAGYLP
jgi:hypothetical protein